MTGRAVSVVLKENEVVLTWENGETEVHLAIDMVDLTLGWANHKDGKFGGTEMVYLPYGLLCELAKIGVLPNLKPTNDC